MNGRKIFLFSDFQKSQWGTFSNDSSIRILAGVLQAEEQSNVFIDSAWFSTPVLGLNRPVSLVYQIVNEGEADQKEKNIRLKSGEMVNLYDPTPFISQLFMKFLHVDTSSNTKFIIIKFYKFV